MHTQTGHSLHPYGVPRVGVFCVSLQDAFLTAPKHRNTPLLPIPAPARMQCNAYVHVFLPALVDLNVVDVAGVICKLVAVLMPSCR